MCEKHISVVDVSGSCVYASVDDVVSMFCWNVNVAKWIVVPDKNSVPSYWCSNVCVALGSLAEEL